MNQLKSNNDLLNRTILPLAIHVGLCTILFSIYCIWFRTPLIADDHRYLWLSTQKDFDYFWMGPPAARSPLHGILFYFLLKMDYLRSSFYFFTILFFAVHAAALYLISSKLAGFFLPRGQYLTAHKYIIAATTLFAFHPNFLEVLFMAMSAAVIPGALFMALTLYTKRFLPLLLFALLAFCSYETYILPIAFIQIFPCINIETKKIEFKKLIFRIFPLTVAIIIYLLSRYFLGKHLGEYEQPITINFSNNIERIFKYFFGVFTIGYPNYLSNILESSVFAIVLFLVYIKSRFLYISKILLILFVGLLSSSLDLFVPYDGIRVIYGSYFLKVSANVLLIHALMIYYREYILILIFLILVPIYSKNLYSIYNIRLDNYDNEKNIYRLVSGMFNMAEPGNTMLLPPTNSIHFNHYDWQLEPNSTIQFKLFRHLLGRKKDFSFRTIGHDSLKFSSQEFPLIIPSRAFVFNHFPAWLPDEFSKTGMAFHVREENYGDAIFGPYLTLDSGRYKVDCYVKIKNECPNVFEFGDLTVKSNSGKNVIGSLKFYTDNFNNLGYTKVSMMFELKNKEKDIETVFFSNGLIDFYIDFIRITKL
jgi:hypothetical protein